MEVPAEALFDALADQRNAAMNDLARVKAALDAAMAEIGRLTEELAKAKAQPVIGDD